MISRLQPESTVSKGANISGSISMDNSRLNSSGELRKYLAVPPRRASRSCASVVPRGRVSASARAEGLLLAPLRARLS